MNTDMNDYEATQADEILKWKNKAPGLVSRASGKLFAPITWAVGKVTPKPCAHVVEKTIEGALIAADALAEVMTDTNDILRDAKIGSIEALQTRDLELSDRLAWNVHKWAMGMAGVEGAASGALGVAGIAMDIPSLITLALRTVRKIGACYGYGPNNGMERGFVMGVLSASGANTLKEKTAALSYVRKVGVVIARNTWKQIEKTAAKNKCSAEALIALIRALAKQLGIKITKKKAAQLIPGVGAVIGGATNVAFINDVALAARRLYQERWLRQNGKLIVV